MNRVPPRQLHLQVRVDARKPDSAQVGEVLSTFPRCSDLSHGSRITAKDHEIATVAHRFGQLKNKTASAVLKEEYTQLERQYAERGKQLADSLGLQFFETSAKENINVRVRKKL